MANTTGSDIVFTQVDEAPELARASLQPIVAFFAGAAGVSVETRDISLAGRILAAFPDHLSEDQRQPDDLAWLGALVKEPHANVMKLPNISASTPQLVAAVRELQGQGYALPDYPEAPQTEQERAVRARYDQVKGSAVNPVLREGNSDRRAAPAVKRDAQKNPHSMGAWSSDSKTHVASMPGGDFYANEKSATISAAQAGKGRIEFVGEGGTTVLKEGLALDAGTVVDATFMSAAALRAFLDAQIAETARQDVLFSLHLKATMMKVSDPIIFGHAVSSWLQPLFDKHGEALKEAGVDPNSGIGDLLYRVDQLPDESRDAIRADCEKVMAERPPMYMVDSDRGITNLHVPSDVIIDASMPAIIRAGGKGWGPDGEQADCKCVIPDRSYAPVYDEAISYFKETGALDPSTAGAVQNVGLMAQKAEEYGSHPTTFEAPGDGTMRVVTEAGEVLHEHQVETGDIWRACFTRRRPIEDWVKLAIERQKATGAQAIFWLDQDRAHDAQLIAFVKPILEAQGVMENFVILAPGEATRRTLETIREGRDSIAITGNVLRDYLTDLFPILELGTSAKMLSIVKLMNGGGLFETGAGGTAPKHVQQLVDQNHLRWDSLGEFCALAESLYFLGQSRDNPRARVLGTAAETATQGVLDYGRSPQYKAGTPDNRDSHYWFARYWAEALAAQTEDTALAAEFAPVAKALIEGEAKITEELAAVQGRAVDIGGYFHPDPARLAAVMRPSPTLNAIIG